MTKIYILSRLTARGKRTVEKPNKEINVEKIIIGLKNKKRERKKRKIKKKRKSPQNCKSPT